MKLLRQATDLNPQSRPVCAAIGVFDGVHLGHRAVLKNAMRDAAAAGGLAVAITFDRHPLATLDPSQAPGLIQSLPQRLGSLETLGLDAAWVIEFNEAFSRQTADAFVANLVRDFRPLKSISVGDTFSFGHYRGGNVEFLRAQESKAGFVTRALSPVMIDGRAVSSSRIREALAGGDLDGVKTLLGRAYTIGGRVLEGRKLGRQLSFPTANLDVLGLALPPFGVYAAWTLVRGERRPSVLNIGVRPTVAGATAQPLCEVHLLDFDGDLYGEELEIELARHLRTEQRFPSLAELTVQIAADVASTRTVLSLILNLRRFALGEATLAMSPRVSALDAACPVPGHESLLSLASAGFLPRHARC